MKHLPIMETICLTLCCCTAKIGHCKTAYSVGLLKLNDNLDTLVDIV